MGKSATAKALIHDLGVCPFSGLVEYSASNLSIEEIRRLFGQTFRYRLMAGNPWHILPIEELELIVNRTNAAQTATSVNASITVLPQGGADVR